MILDSAQGIHPCAKVIGSAKVIGLSPAESTFNFSSEIFDVFLLHQPNHHRSVQACLGSH
jgi:hypothetical protein